MYNTRIEIELEPVGLPEVRITVGNQVTQLKVDSLCIKMFAVDQEAGKITIAVELLNKDDNDPDTAIIVKSISFNGISNPKFVWQGVYYPQYPKHLDGQPLLLPGQNYISWNGVYRLTVTVPIFTWMHQTLGLGWVFD